MTSVQSLNDLQDDNKILASSPSSTTSGCHSVDDSYTEEKNIIPSTLVEDELKLALNKVIVTCYVVFDCN